VAPLASHRCLLSQWRTKSYNGAPRDTVASTATRWRTVQHSGLPASSVSFPDPQMRPLRHSDVPCVRLACPAPQWHPHRHRPAPPPQSHPRRQSGVRGPTVSLDNGVATTTGSLHHSGDPGITLASSVPQMCPLCNSGFLRATMAFPASKWPPWCHSGVPGDTVFSPPPPCSQHHRSFPVAIIHPCWLLIHSWAAAVCTCH
jgi:hypothetical protein